MAGLLAARNAVLAAITAIDLKRLARSSEACRRLMTIPGVGQLTALAFVAAIDDPERFRRSRDVGAYLGLVPWRYQSGEVDYTGSISKCGDRRVRTLLYEAANVLLTRYHGKLALKDWALDIGRRSTMRKARIALARRLAIIMHAMLRHGTESDPLRFSGSKQETETSSRAEHCPREGVGDGADFVACGWYKQPTAFATKPPHTQLTPSSAVEHAENTGTQRQRTTAQDQSGRPLTH
jgi:transposase